MDKLSRIIDRMKIEGVTQLIVSDKMSIFYITGKKIDAGERLLALYININKKPQLVVNELFPQIYDSEIDYVWYNDDQDAVKILSNIVDKSNKIGIDKNWPSGFLIKLIENIPEIKFVNSSYIIDEVRLIKDENEQNLMRESSKINDMVMEELISMVAKGYTEIELKQKAMELYKKYGCEDVSFEPIIAFGKNAANPHHESDELTGKVGDCVVIDIGGLKESYASDMTRTVFIGEIDEFQREIYNIVKEANLRGIRAAKPGAKMCDVDNAARNYIVERGYGKYFTHRTGHSIGIEDHEPGDVSASNSSIIKVGQIFSVEPGIYIPEKNIGIRIEDLVLITEDGCEVLNKYPKDLMVL